MMGRRHSQFKTILIGYDGSAQAEKATETGPRIGPIGGREGAPFRCCPSAGARDDGRSRCHAR